MSLNLELKKAAFWLAPGLTIAASGIGSPLRRSEIQLLRTLAHGADLALDIGASWGLFTLVLARNARRVAAFEPNPQKAAYVRALRLAQCDVHAVALSREAGEAELVFPRDSAALATIEAANPGHRANAADTVRLTVPTRRLDDYGFTGVSLVKIDVEGHELPMLQGAERTLRAHMPVVCAEIEFRHNPAAFADVLGFFQQLGYDAYTVSLFTIRPLSSFDLKRDQIDDAEINTRLARGEYIYNFLFTPRGQSLDRLAAAGFQVRAD